MVRKPVGEGWSCRLSGDPRRILARRPGEPGRIAAASRWQTADALSNDPARGDGSRRAPGRRLDVRSTVPSRNLNRWIFPVAVFGKLSTTSIQRGYFHGPIFCLTCSFSASCRPSVLASARSTTKAFGFSKSFRIGLGHHGGFQHRRMGDQRALDLERRHPDAGDLEHVVAAAAEGVAAVGVARCICRRCGSSGPQRSGGSCCAGSSSLRRPRAHRPAIRRPRHRARRRRLH